jgi:hypothetical protein
MGIDATLTGYDKMVDKISRIWVLKPACTLKFTEEKMQ